MKRSSNAFHVAVACSIAAIVATVVPAIFGTAPDAGGGFKHLGDPWHDFVFNYQTLLTGLAAVAAAFFTIRQMTLIDEESERRHRELLARSHRVDHLRLERALNPQYSDLVQVSQAFRAKQIDRPIFEGENADERHATWLSAELLPHIEEIIKVIGRKQFRDGAVLFGGVLSARLLVLNEAVKALQPRLSYHRNIVHEPYESRERYADYHDYIFDEFRDEKGTIFSQMATLTDVLPLVIREVEKLAKQLEVQIGIVDHDGSITPLQRRA